MQSNLPIKIAEGIKFEDSPNSINAKRLNVHSQEAKQNLSWDRYLRLNKVADQVQKRAQKSDSVLDIGGFDGALAFFLPEFEIDLIDPLTTKSSIFSCKHEELNYDLITAIDVLEHIEPSQREESLHLIANIAKKWAILNYPCQETAEAQEVVYRITNHPLIHEHVKWELPCTDSVIDTMKSLGFSCQYLAYGNLATWVGQYVTLQNNQVDCKEMNRYLIENHLDDPHGKPLYHLVICERNEN